MLWTLVDDGDGDGDGDHVNVICYAAAMDQSAYYIMKEEALIGWRMDE